MNQSILNKSRNDKFVLLFGLPVGIKQRVDPVLMNDFNDNKVQLSIFGLSVPDLSIPPISLGYSGQTYKTSSFSRPDYSPLEVKFFIDNGYHNYYILWKWLNEFNDSKYSTSDIVTTGEIPHIGDSGMENFFSDYVTTLNLIIMDEYNNKLMKIIYEGAFITNLGGISYSHQDGAEIVGSVSFAYNQLHVEMQHNVNDCKVECHDNVR
jgi:hypothetical protein